MGGPAHNDVVDLELQDQRSVHRRLPDLAPPLHIRKGIYQGDSLILPMSGLLKPSLPTGEFLQDRRFSEFL